MSNYFDENITKENEAVNADKTAAIKAAVKENAYLIDIIKAVVNDNYTNEQPEPENEMAEKEKTLLSSEEENSEPVETEQESEADVTDYFAELESKAKNKEDAAVTFAPPNKPGCFVDINNEWFVRKEFDSKYEAKKYFEGRVERGFNRRENAAKREVNRIVDCINSYLENDGKENNYYHRKIEYVSALLSKYLNALNDAGVELSAESIKALSSAPNSEELTYKTVKEKLEENVVEYDEYHNLSWYVKQHFEENTETFFKDGLFGGHDVEMYVVYGIEVDNAIREMAEDIEKNIKANLDSLWSEVLKVPTAFNRMLAAEIVAKLNSINADVERSCA